MNTSAHLRMLRLTATLAAGVLVVGMPFVSAQVAVRGKTVYTMDGPPITDGVVVIEDGMITAVGPADRVRIPSGSELITGNVVTPGLIDAHSVVGLSGILNVDHDQDQLESSAAIQPELRAIDAYNAADPLIEWIRDHGVTTVHTGHAPGLLVSGQTMIVKTFGNTVEEAVMVPQRAIAVTLSSGELQSGSKSPGTRAKSVSMLRAELIHAAEYLDKQSDADEDHPVDRDLRLETLGQVLQGELAFLVTAEKVQDIQSALRLAKEFELKLWLDSASEAYELIPEIQAAGVPVLIHPTMARAVGIRENMSFETASKLRAAGIPVAFQSGYEAYVPKTRVVLFEAGLAAANGLSFEETLAAVTSESARILGIHDRVGSLKPGLHGDVAVYDGDPFEYTTHCTSVIINGQVVSRTAR